MDGVIVLIYAFTDIVLNAVVSLPAVYARVNLRRRSDLRQSAADSRTYRRRGPCGCFPRVRRRRNSPGWATPLRERAARSMDMRFCLRFSTARRWAQRALADRRRCVGHMLHPRNTLLHNHRGGSPRIHARP